MLESLHFIALLCATESDNMNCIDKPHSSHKAYQQALMRRFISNTTEGFQREVTCGNSDKSVCHGWMGVLCEISRVTHITYEERAVGNFSLVYLPNSVRVLTIIGCRQSFAIDTRQLPLDAEHVDLQNNAIVGTVDLGALPPKLRLLNLYKNSITGPLALNRLPETIRVLNFAENRIQQETLFYAKLPPGFSWISLEGGGNRIGRIVPIDQTYSCKAMAQTIFPGIERNRVD